MFKNLSKIREIEGSFVIVCQNVNKLSRFFLQKNLKNRKIRMLKRNCQKIHQIDGSFALVC